MMGLRAAFAGIGLALAGAGAADTVIGWRVHMVVERQSTPADVFHAPEGQAVVNMPAERPFTGSFDYKLLVSLGSNDLRVLDQAPGIDLDARRLEPTPVTAKFTNSLIEEIQYWLDSHNGAPRFLLVASASGAAGTIRSPFGVGQTTPPELLVFLAGLDYRQLHGGIPFTGVTNEGRTLRQEISADNLHSGRGTDVGIIKTDEISLDLKGRPERIAISAPGRGVTSEITAQGWRQVHGIWLPSIVTVVNHGRVDTATKTFRLDRVSSGVALSFDPPRKVKVLDYRLLGPNLSSGKARSAQPAIYDWTGSLPDPTKLLAEPRVPPTDISPVMIFLPFVLLLGSGVGLIVWRRRKVLPY